MTRDDPAGETRAERRLVPKPEWVRRVEARIAEAIPVHPHVLSSIKILVVTPLILLALRQVDVLPARPWLVSLLFFAFAILDYLDGVVAREKRLASSFGRIYDRVTDYPLLVVLSWFCIEFLPVGLLAIKLALDLLLLVLFVLGRGSTENRLRTGISYSTLLALLFLSQGWKTRFFTPELVTLLLLTNIAFSSIVVLYNAGILQKRFIADALSFANLLCGLVSIFFSSRGEVDKSLLFLMLGAAFDGFDGAAARRFGGTRFGVFSDDIADAVNYGIAPGFALAFFLPGFEGVILGLFFTGFTLSRLVFFTMNKAHGDPNYFCGVPSTVGGLIVLSSLVLFENHGALVGLLTGVACAQMVSFDTHYRHLGRAAAAHRGALLGMPAYLVLLVASGVVGGREVPVAIILGACLFYGFLPMALHFRHVLSLNRHTAARLD